MSLTVSVRLKDRTQSSILVADLCVRQQPLTPLGKYIYMHGHGTGCVLLKAHLQKEKLFCLTCDYDYHFPRIIQLHGRPM